MRPRLRLGEPGASAESRVDSELPIEAVAGATSELLKGRVLCMLALLLSAAVALRSPRDPRLFHASMILLIAAAMLELVLRRRFLLRLTGAGVRAGLDRAAALLLARRALRGLVADEASPGQSPLPLVPEIVVTVRDRERIEALLASCCDSTRSTVALRGELARATTVHSANVQPDVVTMNSRVTYIDEFANEGAEVFVVYPRAENRLRGRVSVLSPLGAALLGLRVGQTIDWRTPRGELHRYRVLAVSYQPEAAGHFHL